MGNINYALMFICVAQSECLCVCVCVCRICVPFVSLDSFSLEPWRTAASPLPFCSAKLFSLHISCVLHFLLLLFFDTFYSFLGSPCSRGYLMPLLFVCVCVSTRTGFLGNHVNRNGKASSLTAWWGADWQTFASLVFTQMIQIYQGNDGACVCVRCAVTSYILLRNDSFLIENCDDTMPLSFVSFARIILSVANAAKAYTEMWCDHSLRTKWGFLGGKLNCFDDTRRWCCCSLCVFVCVWYDLQTKFQEKSNECQVEVYLGRSARWLRLWLWSDKKKGKQKEASNGTETVCSPRHSNWDR